MNWFTAACAMAASACATLAIVHFIVWLRRRHHPEHLLFALTAFGAGAVGLVEMLLSRSVSAAQYGSLIRWQHIPLFLLLVSMVWFVRIYFDAGRRSLAWLVTVLWSVALIVNFAAPHSLTFANLTEARRVEGLWGAIYTVPVGVVNPWKVLADAATLLLVVFVVDASRLLWRRGNRRRAAVIGGSITFFLVAAGIHTVLVDAGVIRMPYMISFTFLAIVAAMSFELSGDVVQAAELSRQARADEERWRSLLENVELAVVGFDPAWLVTYANPFFSRLTGFSADELRGRHLSALVVEAEVEAVWNAARSGPPPHSRWTVRSAAGGERTVNWSSVRLQSPDAVFAGVLCVGADVTERLRALHDLQQAQRDIEHLSRTNLLGEFTSALAHELNQPLAAILSNAQAARRFLARTPPNFDELDAILADVIRDDKRAGQVIHRLWAMLRKEPVARERFCLNIAIREVVEIVAGEMIAKQVDVRLSLADELPMLAAGRVEVQQVVMNLLLNSMQAMKDTPADRRVVSVATAANDGAVETTVRDHGCGIAPDKLPHIFDAFVTTRSAGLGMGLAICRRLIEAHGGRIEARNNRDGGATVLFSLPLTGREGTDQHERA